MSSTSFKQPSPEILINELCELLGQKSRPPTQKFTGYALQTLSRLGDHPLPNSDENSIVDRLKRDLASKGKIQDAAKLSELCRKLSASGCVKNLWSVLHLLRSLSRNSRSGAHVGNAMLFRQGLVAASTPVVDMTPASNMQSSGLSSSGFGTVKSEASGNGLPSKVGTPGSAFQNLTLGSRLAWGLTPSRTADSLLKSEKKLDGSAQSHGLTRSERSGASTSSKEPLEEGRVIRELIDVFQGMETEHFKLSMRESAYRLVPTASVDKRVSQRAHKLCELGWLHDRIRKYIDKHSKDLAFGLVGQAFCAALQQELGEYYRLLSVFQSQLYQEDQGLGGVGEYGVTLSKLTDWTCEPMDRLKWVATLVDNCRDRKGGALASTIHSFMQTGDVNMRLLTKRFLTIVSQPIFYILSRWLYEGELQDTFHEFFVAMDPSVSNERLWHEKYHIRQSMVPSFITDGQARKILLVGKSLNFLRLVCRDRTEVHIGKQEFDLPEDVFANSTLDFCSELQERVNEAYEATSRCLLEVLFDRYKLLTHLQALRKFLLLGQGDFVRHLLDLLHDDLAKPASQLYRHNLNGLVEAAVRATNAQFEDPDVQSRLDLRLLEINPGDTGWDVFSLDYHINQPLNTIVSPEIMLLYLRCFNFLWRAKRMEHNLATIWTDTMDHSRRLSPDLPELRGVLHACHVLAAEMVHLVHQIQYYIAFEVLECSWADLLKKVEAAKDLDEVIKAHNNFLENIMKRCLLDQESQGLLAQLRSIFDQIVKFETLKGKIYEWAMSELTRRKRYDATVVETEKKGVWGVDSAKEEEEVTKRREFRKEEVPKMRTQLRICAKTYQDMVIKFLSQLTQQADPNLRYLSWRLDFNDHYKTRDPSWKTPGSVRVKQRANQAL